MRIKLPDTIPVVNIEGKDHVPDADGVFDVPAHQAHELVRQMGGAYMPNVVSPVLPAAATAPTPPGADVVTLEPAPAAAPVVEPVALKTSTAAGKKKA